MRWRVVPPLSVAIACLIAVATLAGCQRRAQAPAAGESSGVPEAAEYVGGEACAECHAREAEKWRASDHFQSMRPATAVSVLADFGGSSFTAHRVTSTFFLKEGGYAVRTDGPDGKTGDFRITHTFGFDPLQQFLVEMPGGRLQALSVVWDARPKARGGQRWFHLYPNEPIRAGDVLHWTAVSQSWNYMCAECHSTDLRKNYDPATDRYATTWKDVNVSCEACHGPGSRHVAWARSPAQDRRSADRTMGLVFDLQGASSGSWAVPPGESIAKRTPAVQNRVEIETCGRCHARRGQISPDFSYGGSLEQSHRVSLLDEGLSQADGQQLDEVYEYGSFLQSKMFAAGVTCSNCHDPHDGRLIFAGNAVCTQCHVPTKYDVPAHHFHKPRTRAAECVSCHMVPRDYMIIDARLDHGFRVPRPDESARLGTPNACTDCHDHRKQTAAWAAAATAKWYGPSAATRPSFAPAIHAGRSWQPQGVALLSALVADPATTAIVRATGLSLLTRYSGPKVIEAISQAARDADPLVRRTAGAALDATDEATRLRIGAALLADPVRSVRVEAVTAMVPVSSSLSGDDRQAFDRAVAEFRAVQRLNGELAGSWVNLGTLELGLGRLAEAEVALRTALKKEPQFVPGHVNLADVLRRQGRESEAERVLRQALEVVETPADVHNALGLALVRQRRTGEALTELSRASSLAPGNPRFAFVYGVALHDTGDSKGAVRVLEDAQRQHPADRSILDALAMYAMESGDLDRALAWTRLALEAAPGDPAATRQLRQLEQAAGGQRPR